jgi:hypothetical protein
VDVADVLRDMGRTILDKAAKLLGSDKPSVSGSVTAVPSFPSTAETKEKAKEFWEKGKEKAAEITDKMKEVRFLRILYL